jgi:plasmid stability protein
MSDGHQLNVRGRSLMTAIHSEGFWSMPLIGMQAYSPVTWLCLHNVSMPNVLVRDVPDEVHSGLQHRAEQRGQSLQQYLSAELRRLAEQPTMDEVLARVAGRRGGRVGLEQAVADLDAGRDRR